MHEYTKKLRRSSVQKIGRIGLARILPGRTHSCWNATAHLDPEGALKPWDPPNKRAGIPMHTFIYEVWKGKTCLMWRNTKQILYRISQDLNQIALTKMTLWSSICKTMHIFEHISWNEWIGRKQVHTSGAIVVTWSFGFWEFQIVDSRDFVCLQNVFGKYVGEISRNRS